MEDGGGRRVEKGWGRGRESEEEMEKYGESQKGGSREASFEILSGRKQIEMNVKI